MPAAGLLLLLAACRREDPWPEPGSYYPYVYTPEADLEPYEEVRFETQTWTPEADPDQLGLYLRKSYEHRPGAPVESRQHFAAMRGLVPPLGEGLRIDFAGDVMWVGDNWAEVATPAAGLFDGDLRVANLETPTSPLHPTDQGALGLYAFNAPPEYLDGLPFDVLQLNNNHSLDAGDEGLEATVDEVASRGFAWTGVDQHVQVGEVAFLSYTWGLNDPEASSAHDLFIVPFGHLDDGVDLSTLAEQVAAAREAAASVVVLLHWGFEYEYYPDPHFMVLARAIVAAGADVVVGTGPHVVQPPEICHVNRPEQVPGVGSCSVLSEDGVSRTAAVLYSLGNFATDMVTVPCQVGAVVSVSLDPDVTGLGWRAVANVDGPWVVPLMEATDDEEIAQEAVRLEAHLGAGWRRD